MDKIDGDTLEESGSTQARRRKRQNYYQPINKEEEQSNELYIPPGSVLGLDPLSQAFSVELRCLDVFADVMDTIPEELCYLGKSKLAASNNINCWTGTNWMAKER